MKRFTATVQLFNAEKKDYDTLTTELARESFQSNKSQAGKIKRNLLPQEFVRTGNISLQEVSTSVSKAAFKTGKKYAFTVIKSKSN